MVLEFVYFSGWRCGGLKRSAAASKCTCLFLSQECLLILVLGLKIR